MNEQATNLLNLMKAADRSGAHVLIERLLNEGYRSEQLLNEILDPALVQVGALWGNDSVSLSQAFVAAKIAEDILVRCAPEMESENKTPGIPVVIGNIEDDFHSLGRRIIASFLMASGWQVHDLGNDVLPEDFLKTALEVGAPVIGASAMMQTTALNIRKIRHLIDQNGLSGQIKLAVGGAVFNWRPELMDEVGGDGTAANAAEVNALFRKLKAETENG